MGCNLAHQVTEVPEVDDHHGLAALHSLQQLLGRDARDPDAPDEPAALDIFHAHVRGQRCPNEDCGAAAEPRERQRLDLDSFDVLAGGFVAVRTAGLSRAPAGGAPGVS
jgi:hypothetical protein